ncbi:uncharacterized protein SPPG_06872 [Spizellomyces punctatus DAOM BR117]|uniref:VLRF1 domain-containing protein n=1 Tax=Spizellomyces punctatus (strain DAOM BR117) TaxID=645134 RepID=A0A0L0H8L9_SPIPD|nr:uncharacterized protein SPPG_06872 [Spizellomyces punctatus DAOM BR117]KNC97880.1 hypothetical protein SPPG_06872 [Spizellomyces punctatus DAOM BR117]|eukprot:XP_016605920.1 hypothetical protein SPPG_06872 [Spizellomyces punctatus DAOM BR117]
MSTQRRNAENSKCFQLFALPSDILASVTENTQVVEGLPGISTLPSVAKPEQPCIQPTSTSGCSTCGGLQFPSSEEMRTHYKSDWHRYNIKRKVRGQGPVSEEQFDDLTEVSSIEASDEEDDEEDRPTHPDMIKAGSMPDSPFVMLPLGNEECLLVYKQIFSSSKRDMKRTDNAALIVERLRKYQSLQQPTHWTLLMLAAGHFAGTVVNCKDGTAIVHKTFHRYTTRRKQGGAQSSNDQAKGKANSAGAGLRRYNEQALQKEIRDLLVEWKDYLSTSDLIFIRAPAASRKVLFFDGGPLDAGHDRIRSFPFTTRRPTFSELMRCFKELTTIRIERLPEIPDVHATSQSEALRPKPRPKPVSPEAVKDNETTAGIDPLFLKLADFCKRGKLELFQSHLKANEGLNVKTRLPDEAGTSLLHLAATNGCSEMVNALLSLGADPTMGSEKRNLKPYDVAQSKDTRDAFRRFVASQPDMWDWKQAHVPGPLTPEMEQQQKEKEKEKKKKMKDKQKAYKSSKEAATPVPEPVLVPAPSSKKTALSKLTKSERESIGMTAERRARLDREKRALAAEARIRVMQNQCGACGKSLVGITPFEKLQFRYCSMPCVTKHQILTS